jgi:hypothetical protein
MVPPRGECLSDRMKDEYITAFDDLARIEFNDNPATFGGVWAIPIRRDALHMRKIVSWGCGWMAGLSSILVACHRDLNRA